MTDLNQLAVEMRAAAEHEVPAGLHYLYHVEAAGRWHDTATPSAVLALLDERDRMTARIAELEAQVTEARRLFVARVAMLNAPWMLNDSGVYKMWQEEQNAWLRRVAPKEPDHGGS